MKYFKRLTGEKIYLSPINIDDVNQYTKWLNQSDILIPLGLETLLLSLTKEREKLESYTKSNDSFNFSIIKKDSDELLGNISLFFINQIHQEATIGLFIGEKHNRGKGYGKEAMLLILDYGFNFLNLHNIKLEVFEFNKAAIFLYEKIGFKTFGIRHETHYLDNKRYNQHYMEIIKSDFTSKYIKRID